MMLQYFSILQGQLFSANVLVAENFDHYVKMCSDNLDYFFVKMA